MLGNLCDPTTPQNSYKSCIEITEWNSSPQSEGCIKYKGKYYVNRIPGNLVKPDEGLLTGSYAVGSEDYCAIIKYHCNNQNSCETSSDFMKFFNNINEYSNCTEGQTFDCDEFIIFKNKDGDYELHQSLIDANDRHPHDREAWKNLGVFSNILKLIFDESEGKQITLPYWEECNGPNCATVYSQGDSVVERVDNGVVDNCGNPVYDELIYQSLVDKNTDRPSLGADKDEPTWIGPYSDMEWVTRQVGFTLNEEPIEPGNSHILITEHEFSNNFEILVDENGSRSLHTKNVGTDQNGKVIGNGSDADLLTTDYFCDKFEVIEVESGECEQDCDPVTKVQICPKDVGVNQDGDVITNGSDVNLITTDALVAPLQWQVVEEPECLEDCTHPTRNRLGLCIDKGLQIVNECLNVFVDMTKGLDFNADGSIFVKIKNGLTFNGNGEIEVVATNNSIIVSDTGVSVGQIGIDRNGNPVNAGACLVTCDTDLHVTAIDDTGNETTLTISDGTTVVGPEEDITVQAVEDTGNEIRITLTNGSVVSGVKIDNDDFVANTSETVNPDDSLTITLTMNSGTTHTITVPAPAPSTGADGVVDSGSVVNGDVTLTRTEGLPSITFPLCDMAWMLPKIIEPTKKSTRVDVVGPSWADTIQYHDPAELLSAPIVESLTFTNAELVALGMRPSDNSVKVRLSAFSLLRVSATDDPTPDNLEYDALVLAQLTGGVSRNAFASSSAVMSDPNAAPDRSGEDQKEAENMIFEVPLDTSGGLTLDTRMRVSKTPGASPISGAETYPLHSLRMIGEMEILGFLVSDDGSFTAKGGCADQGPNQ